MLPKKANELMAYSYSHLYGIPSTGLRFLPYMARGRPDMSHDIHRSDHKF